MRYGPFNSPENMHSIFFFLLFAWFPVRILWQSGDVIKREGEAGQKGNGTPVSDNVCQIPGNNACLITKISP